MQSNINTLEESSKMEYEDIEARSDARSESEGSGKLKIKKMVIPGLHKMILRTNEGKQRMAMIETKSVIGTTLKNAISGYPYTPERDYQYKVGSFQEDALFKVKIVNGMCGKNTQSFFYDSPEQFEAHFGCTLSDKVRSDWREKNVMYKAIRAKDRERSAFIEV